MCLGALLAMGYPEKCIRRVAARDGNLYRDHEHARATALSECPPSLFISDNWLGGYYYHWAWTWYEILIHISKQAAGSYHLVLVDDWTMRLRYDELLDILDRVSTNLKMIQFHWSEATPKRHVPIKAGAAVAGTPLKRGCTHAGDAVTLFTPAGGRDALQIMNRTKFGTPEWVPYVIGRELDQTGFYSPANSETRLTRYLGVKEHIDPFQDGRQS